MLCSNNENLLILALMLVPYIHMKHPCLLASNECCVYWNISNILRLLFFDLSLKGDGLVVMCGEAIHQEAGV